MKGNVIPAVKPKFALPWLTCFVLVAILGLEFVSRRFWCKNLCPLGGLWALLALPARLRRVPRKECPDCGDCAQLCRTGASGAAGECVLCMTCRAECSHGRVRFKFRRNPKPPVREALPDLTRRQVTLGLAGGLVIPPLLYLGPMGRPGKRLIRPPGVADEKEYTRRCVRCGLCTKVCLTGGLVPALFEAGPTSLYTARLDPRQGYCAFQCTLCGQVCPTAAIPRLPLKVKQRFKMGTARFDLKRCIPFKDKVNCLVCEEHCPTSPKAIVFDHETVVDKQGRVKQMLMPRVEPERCIGCGICENKCPVDREKGGEAAIFVYRLGRAPAVRPRPSWHDDPLGPWEGYPRRQKKRPGPYGG